MLRTDRRALIARTALSLVDKPGPLSESERRSLQTLRPGLDETEREISDYRTERAWGRYLRFGFDGLQSEEKRMINELRDMTTGASAAGIATSGAGIFVPAGFYDRVTAAMKYSSAMLDVAKIVDTETGQPLPFPADNDSAESGEFITESTQVTQDDAQNITSVVLKPFKVSSKMVIASNELAADAGFDFEQYLVDRFARRIGKAVNPKFTSGAGNTEPLGILASASSGGTAVGANTNDGTSGANTLGSDDFATLEASVDPIYRGNARWMTHPNTLESLRKQKDKQGHPLFAGLHSGGVDMILNYPIAVNPDMDQLQTQVGSPPVTRKVLMFGDFSKYVIRRVRPTMLRLSQRFADFGKTGFLLFWRQDGALIDGGGGAVKVMSTVY